MKTRSDLLPQILLGGLVVAAVIAGIIVVGGPKAGRMERRDTIRLEDLRKLAEFVRCVASTENKQLPEVLQPQAACTGQARLADPYTDVPYTYRKTSDTTFQVCAAFERPDAVIYTYFASGTFDAETGCATVTYYR
ncbi:MAG: hypothetical protein HUJ27_11890 [Rhodobacteraceae bacterium]|nr:hypothetical protein [Paracoccaceae bacterium]